jgi:hypothetical protein
LVVGHRCLRRHSDHVFVEQQQHRLPIVERVQLVIVKLGDVLRLAYTVRAALDRDLQ